MSKYQTRYQHLRGLSQNGFHLEPKVAVAGFAAVAGFFADKIASSIPPGTLFTR